MKVHIKTRQAFIAVVIVLGLGIITSAAVSVLNDEMTAPAPTVTVTSWYSTLPEPAKTVTAAPPSNDSCRQVVVLAKKLADATVAYEDALGDIESEVDEATKSLGASNINEVNKRLGNIQRINDKTDQIVLDFVDIRSQYNKALESCPN